MRSNASSSDGAGTTVSCGVTISHGVWLYYRFTLSYRDVQELLYERGITVSHEAVRQWCLKFGQGYANQLKRRRPRPGDKWHLDEVFLTINGERHYLWRAVGIVKLLRLRRSSGKGVPLSGPPHPLGSPLCARNVSPTLESLPHLYAVL
jgi:hypothetical protein